MPSLVVILLTGLQYVVGTDEIGKFGLQQLLNGIRVQFIILERHQGPYRERTQGIVHAQGRLCRILPACERIHVRATLAGTVQVHPAYQVGQRINQRGQRINVLTK